MAVNHFTFTLDGTAQRLSTGLSGPGAASALKFLSIQALASNTHVVYVGGNNRTLSSTDYGYRIEVPVTSVPYAPTVIELSTGAFSLGEFYVLGTNGEKIQLLVVTP